MMRTWKPIYAVTTACLLFCAVLTTALVAGKYVSQQQAAGLEAHIEQLQQDLAFREEQVDELMKEREELQREPTYFDIAYVPEGLKTVEMGELFPYLIVGGQRLQYSAKDKWYHFAGSDVRAMWLRAGDQVILGTTDRRLPDGTTEIWVPGHWEPVPKTP